jgi:Uma2 family endonuclease
MGGMTAGREESAARRAKLTYDDFVLFPDDGMRHELIDGEHYVSPSPNTRHQRISRRLLLALANWLEAHPVGEVFAAPFDVVFTRFDVVEPDILFVANERAAAYITDVHATGADLVIEIGSPSTRKRDETIKRRLYERAGVVEYWFVDPERDLIRVYRRDGERFAAPVEMASDADPVTTDLLPGFALSLDSVFER